MENGGLNQNATTNKDMTSYFVSLPSDKLRFWAETESERIFHPIFREFYEEKEVVREERRMRVENDPDGRLEEALLEAAFEKSPYRWPTIGYDDDIVKLTVQDLKKFWTKYYHPSNAIGVLVGQFDIREAEKILNKTFGHIQFPGDPLTSRKYTDEVRQTKERRVLLKLSARPRLWIAYHKPTLPDADDYLFDLLDQILGDGRSSRLYRKLVLEKKIASNIGTTTGIPGSRLPNLFVIQVDLLEGHTPAEALRFVDEEIRRLQKESIPLREVERAKNRLHVSLLWQLKSNEGLASQLSYYEMIAGDWHYLANYLEAIENFTGEDLQWVSQKYLIPSNRTLAEIRP
ncbi:MAG: insulinase family protein [Deltaproteobacteria bacterium]|nr:insulinase family protein [Deltaproteobacteria bacterium]